MPVEHFTYGLLTPGLAYAISVLGSLLGLICTRRARNQPDSRSRARWLLLAAWSIGGTGIWVMHFMAMIGFSVPGEPVRYDISITLASWIIAIVVVAIGLYLVGFGRPSAIRIVGAGTFTGIGVAAMHYTGMAAMHVPADVTYDRKLVGASIGIAIVAATVALWFTVSLRRAWAIVIAALIMGVAVSGMHYTGMYALRISDFVAKPVGGLIPITLIAPIVVFVVAVIVVLMVSLLNREGTDGADAGGDPTMILVTPPLGGPLPQSGRTSPAAFTRRP